MTRKRPASHRLLLVAASLVVLGCQRTEAPAEAQTRAPAVAATATGAPNAAAGSAPSHSKPSDEELRSRLSPMQYRVTQQDGTEPPFRNEYWDEKRDGIYVDIVSGEPLFSSRDKYVSGTGWPSFTRPLVEANLVTHDDYKLGGRRTEVRSKHADSHLGHVFPDGPAPTGLRYCMNSAAMRFIPAETLESEGYGAFRELFEASE